MRQGWLDRVLIVLSGLLLAVMGVFLFLLGIRFPKAIFDVGIRFTQGLFGLRTAQTLRAGPWYVTSGLVLAGLIFFMWGVRQIIHLFLRPRKTLFFEATELEGGNLQIARQALERLVDHCVSRHEEFSEAKIAIIGAQDQVSVRLRVTLREGVYMPRIAQTVQSEIHEYLAECAGVKVMGVQMIVEDTQPLPEQQRLLPPVTAVSAPAEPEPEPVVIDMDIEAELAKTSDDKIEDKIEEEVEDDAGA